MLNHNLIILIAGLFYIVFIIQQIYKKKSATQIYTFSALYFYLVAVLCLVFFPFPFQQNLLESLRSELRQPQNNFIPFHDLYQIVSKDTWADIVKQIGGNIFMLTPFGFLIPIAKPQTKFSKVVLWGVLFSLFIEVFQLILDTVIQYNYRTSDVDDVLCNTFGVVVGFAIFKIIDKPLGITSYVTHSNKSHATENTSHR